jgi:hypothetical protein
MMNSAKMLVEWAENIILSTGYVLNAPSETILTAPWSNIIRFSTTNGFIYLKQIFIILLKSVIKSIVSFKNLVSRIG